MKDWKQFVTAGRAIFTLQDTRTSDRYTFKVSKKNEIFFVSVMTGSDNVNDYTYLGLIRDGEFVETHRTRVTKPRTGNSFVWFKRLWEIKNSDEELASHMKFYHAGFCGRCGRQLTVPTSIKSGYGPECIAFMCGIMYSGDDDIHKHNRKELKKLLRLHEKLNAK